jgi:MFS family permease
MLVAGRFINGLSVGILSAQVPVYITEIAPPSKRGRLVGCQQCELIKLWQDIPSGD